MSTYYYGPKYNSYPSGGLIAKGDEVEVIERDIAYRDEITVIVRGTVSRFDNTKATEGYTVKVRAKSGDVYSARPDELRKVVQA